MTRSFAPLAVAHENFRAAEIDVLHPKAKRLHDAQTGAIEKLREQPMRSLHGTQKPLHLIDGQDDRQAPWRLRAYDAIQPAHVFCKDLAIQEQQGALRLVLRGNRHVQVDGEVRQELLDFVRGQLVGRTSAMEPNEPTHPIDISLLRAQAVAPVANPVSQPPDEPIQFGLHLEYSV